MNPITREEWRARPPKATHRISLFQPKLILHHAAGAVLPGDDFVSDADLRRIRGIQGYHMFTRGWNDIAYSFLNDPDGFSFEGRGAGIANGATKGHGASSYAICVMGHYDIQTPEDDLITGLANSVAWGHELGLWPLGFTHGHRDLGSTSCPGIKLYPLIPRINQLAEEIYMGTYRTVRNVPWDDKKNVPKPWAKDAIDDGVAVGAINIDDKYPEDWERTMSYGDYWTMQDRLGWPKGTKK